MIYCTNSQWPKCILCRTHLVISCEGKYLLWTSTFFILSQTVDTYPKLLKYSGRDPNHEPVGLIPLSKVAKGLLRSECCSNMTIKLAKPWISFQAYPVHTTGLYYTLGGRLTVYSYWVTLSMYKNLSCCKHCILYLLYTHDAHLHPPSTYEYGITLLGHFFLFIVSTVCTSYI